MRLHSLYLSNFQGVREAKYEFSGANATIFGDNATGKTTLFNSVTWLLFGKPSTGAKNYTPKTKDLDGDVHYLDHSVEGKFALSDGQLITLKKIYKEDYKLKRGSSVEEFNGHIVDYFIDGVPSKEKEYQAYVENAIGKEERLKLLMMPNYFAENLPWTDRRKILLEMCGDVSDIDVINSTLELRDLLTFLAIPGASDKHYPIDDYKKIADGKRKEINKELQTIPARIDEAQKAMPDVSTLDIAKIDAELASINATVNAKEDEKRQLLSGDSTAETIRKQVASLQTQLAEARANHAKETSSQNEAAYVNINTLRVNQQSMKDALQDKKNAKATLCRKHGDMLAQRQTLLNTYSQISAEEWTGNEICPTCNRALPEEDIAQAKETFNLSKSKRLEETNNTGQQKCSKEMIAGLEEEISVLDGEILSMEGALANYVTSIAAAEQTIKPTQLFEETEVYTTISLQIADLQTNGHQANTAIAQQATLLDEEIKQLRLRVSQLMGEKSSIGMAEYQAKRIDELMAQDKQLAQEYERLQQGVYLCEEFIKAKVAMLTDKINSKFKSVRFRLFIDQVNGGIKEDCEVMVPGDAKLVPYTLANNAARTNAGLEIIDALSKHWQIEVPVFVDNAESVTQLQRISPQVIRLVVSETDKVLRMEATP